MGRHRRRQASRQELGLQGAGALLLAVSACIHLDLYLTGYRSIPTIGWLFLVQVIVGFVLTAAVLVTRSSLAAAASAGFALSTLGAYLIAVWNGLFGFKEIRTRAGIAAGLIEVAAFGVLALAAIAVRRRAMARVLPAHSSRYNPGQKVARAAQSCRVVDRTNAPSGRRLGMPCAGIEAAFEAASIYLAENLAPRYADYIGRILNS